MKKIYISVAFFIARKNLYMCLEIRKAIEPIDFGGHKS